MVDQVSAGLVVGTDTELRCKGSVRSLGRERKAKDQFVHSGDLVRNPRTISEELEI